jgi:hypothetical protein
MRHTSYKTIRGVNLREMIKAKEVIEVKEVIYQEDPGKIRCK